jgi:putative transposase
MFFTCSIRGWSLGQLLDTSLILAALQMALSLCIPEIHHSDQGVQHAATEYVACLKKCEIRISMASSGKPEENRCAERLRRASREEEVDLSEYNDFADAHS